MELITVNVIHAIHETAPLPRYNKLAPSFMPLHKLSESFPPLKDAPLLLLCTYQRNERCMTGNRPAYRYW